MEKGTKEKRSLSAAGHLDIGELRSEKYKNPLTYKGRFQCPKEGDVVLVNKKCYHESAGRKGYIHLDTNYIGRVVKVWPNFIHLYRITGGDERNIKNPQESFPRVVEERRDELTSGALQFRILDGDIPEDVLRSLTEEELDIKEFSKMFLEVILRLPDTIGRATMGEKP